MPNENPYDRLARVFDNAVANYTEEAQRKKLLAENEARRLALRDEALKDRDEERTYAEKQRAARRSEDVADRTEARGYAEEQRQKIRGENREDTLWTNEQSMIAALVQEGFLNPADRKDPAKVAAAWAQLTPEAKQRVQDRKQAIDDIVKMVGQFGTMGVPGAETPELLQGDAVFQVAGALRQKAAATKQRFGETAAKLMQDGDRLQTEYNQVSQLIDPTVTQEDIQAAARKYGPKAAAPEYQEMIAADAEKIAVARATAANAKARALAGQINAATSRLGTLDNLSRAGVYLPESAPATAPAAPAAPAQPDAEVDPLTAIFGAKAKGAKPQPQSAPQPQEFNPFAEAAAKEQNAEKARRAAAQFIDLYPSASRTNEQLQASVNTTTRPVLHSGVGSPFSSSWWFPEANATEKAEHYTSVANRRDADKQKAAELFAAFKDYIDLLPEDQKQQIAQMSALFQAPAQ